MKTQTTLRNSDTSEEQFLAVLFGADNYEGTALSEQE